MMETAGSSELRHVTSQTTVGLNVKEDDDDKMEEMAGNR
jgi:hypothetical protein